MVAGKGLTEVLSTTSFTVASNSFANVCGSFALLQQTLLFHVARGYLATCQSCLP